MKCFFKLALLFVSLPVAGQTIAFTSKIYETYKVYKEPAYIKGGLSTTIFTL